MRSKLDKLVDEKPEMALNRAANISTDVEDEEQVRRKGPRRRLDDKPRQLTAKIVERAMKACLVKLREAGKDVGLHFDTTAAKSQSGRPWEKWADPELATWKKNASKLAKPIPVLGPICGVRDGTKEAQVFEHKLNRLEDKTHDLSRQYDNLKYVRMQKEKKIAEMKHALELEAAEMERMMELERIKSKDTTAENLKERLKTNEAEYLETNKQNEQLKAIAKEIQEQTDQVAKATVIVQEQVTKHIHDVKAMWVSLKTSQHDIERALGQGKLVQIKSIGASLKVDYEETLEEKREIIREQDRFKKRMDEHKERMAKFEEQVRRMYDPNVDSPRRNELKRKEKLFETVFDSMMEKIGESDVNKIVDMFQTQKYTQKVWQQTLQEWDSKLEKKREERDALEREISEAKLNADSHEDNHSREFSVALDKVRLAEDRMHSTDARVQNLHQIVAHSRECIVALLDRLAVWDGLAPASATAASAEPDILDGELASWVSDFQRRVVALHAKIGPLVADLDMSKIVEVAGVAGEDYEDDFDNDVAAKTDKPEGKLPGSPTSTDAPAVEPPITPVATSPPLAPATDPEAPPPATVTAPEEAGGSALSATSDASETGPAPAAEAGAAPDAPASDVPATDAPASEAPAPTPSSPAKSTDAPPAPASDEGGAVPAAAAAVPVSSPPPAANRLEFRASSRSVSGIIEPHVQPTGLPGMKLQHNKKMSEMEAEMSLIGNKLADMGGTSVYASPSRVKTPFGTTLATDQVLPGREHNMRVPQTKGTNNFIPGFHTHPKQLQEDSSSEESEPDYDVIMGLKEKEDGEMIAREEIKRRAGKIVKHHRRAEKRKMGGGAVE